VIDPEGHQLHIITVGQSDTAPSTKVHIPGLNAVIAGDVAYNGIHQWLADTDHEKRMQWITSRSRRSTRGRCRQPQAPDAPDDDPGAVLGGTKTCIRDFDRSLSESHSAQELADKMMALHGDLGNPYTLWTAAKGVF